MIIQGRTELDEIIKLYSGKREIYVVGAGGYGNEVGLYLNWLKAEWNGYIDMQKEGKLNGKVILSYNALNPDGIFVLSSVDFREGMKEALFSQSVPEENIVEIVNNELLYEIRNVRIDVDFYVNKINKFHNCYKGKRCFIIGNGPSLKAEDLEVIKNEISFATNFIYTIYPYTNWRPTFYITQDTLFANKIFNNPETILEMTKSCVAAFTSVWLKAFEFRDNPDLEKLFFYKTKYTYEENGMPFFSDDVSKQIYLIGTVTYTMLQLAVYMGFSEIYLLGMDNQYAVEEKKNGEIVHNDVENYNKYARISVQQLKEERGNVYTDSVSVETINLGFMAARKYAERNGIKIFNATRGGKLEVFERVEFDLLNF